MLDVSGTLGSSGEGSSADEARESAGNGGGEVGVVGPSSGGLSEEEKVRIEESDRNFGSGNRWPRQETLALLKIRSDMDAAFRDSSLKGPLWEEVSRKLAEIGYHRSAKKCREKFENVYKYHRRTKESRCSKPVGKTYRFFDQLEALESQTAPSLPPLPPPRQPQTHRSTSAPPAATAVSMPATSPIVRSSSSASPVGAVSQFTITVPTINPVVPANSFGNFKSASTSSSSTSSDEEPERRRKRKRKWLGFFQRLMLGVIEKQEQMQKRFLETLEAREHERLAREDAWRVQQMARINREHEFLVQERSMAVSKDAAMIAFLQKITEQPKTPNPAPPQMQQDNSLPPLPPPPKSLDHSKSADLCENILVPASASRWPKAEIEALISIRSKLDVKYAENAPKGPLWEEISAAMRGLGYDRSAKRCKEKWENINKYFKKVKESTKKRPENSKTCPYFDQLDALYKEKSKNEHHNNNNLNSVVPKMIQPEQQWPPEQHLQESDNHESENTDEDEDGDDEDEVGGYEIVMNKPSSAGAAE